MFQFFSDLPKVRYHLTPFNVDLQETLAQKTIS